MSQDYQRPICSVEHEIEIKNSRFIACLAPTQDAAAVKEWLTDVKRRWPKANHYCTASIVGSPFYSKELASSDDGEPSGTAGKPMLMVLQNQPIGDIAAVVVRYFGGVKLGTGGLQRAYSQAVAEALQQVALETCVFRQRYSVCYDYADQGALEALWQQFDVAIVDSTFTDKVEQTIDVIPANLGPLQQRLDSSTQGRVKLSEEHSAGLE